MRSLVWVGCVCLVILVSGCGDDPNRDNLKLPPRERAARFEKFVKPGMDWTEVARAFPPTKVSLGVTDLNDHSKHIGGTYLMPYKGEATVRDMYRDFPNQDGLNFRYFWTRDEWWDANFDKSGKFVNVWKGGDFNQ
jgi:hypothetical protein